MNKLARFKWSILLVVIGLGFNGVALMSILSSVQDSGTSFLGPGETIVTIKKPGDYTLWNETRTLIDGQFMTFPEDLPSGTVIKIIGQTNSIPVPLRKSGGSRMESGGTLRLSLGQVTFIAPGEYKIVVSGLKENRAFYLDEATLLQTFVSVLLFGVGGMLVLFAGVISAIYVLVQISRRPKP